MTRFTKAGTAYEFIEPTNGSSENRPVIVLIHGLGLTRSTWQGHLARLSERYRVLSYDLFGHGESNSLSGPASLSLFAEQLLQLLIELQLEEYALVGFSLGGMINRRFALDNPEIRCSLLIVNSPHERAEEAQRLVEQQADLASSGGASATIDKALARWFTEEFRASNSDVIEQIKRWVLANKDSDYASCRRVLAYGVTELIRPKPALSNPTLVITCEHDSGSTPEMTMAIAAEIPGATTLIIPRLKHMGLVEQPELFIQPMLDFLDAQI